MFILILGLGRTGNHLGQLLLDNGYQVAGTTRDEAKAKEMSHLGIIPVRWDNKDGTANLPESDIIVCSFPPGELYAVQMTALAERYPTSKIIQISSTGVFGKMQEVVTENTKPVPDSPSGEVLAEAENVILEHTYGQVVRAGGLYDETSHPVSFLSGKKDIKDGKAPVNLIHRRDLAEIIFEMIEQKITQKIVHAVNPEHPTKSEYYTKKAQELGLEPPHFSLIQETNKEIQTSLSRPWRSL